MYSQELPKKKSKQIENKQETLLSRVKPCTSDTEPGVVQETIWKQFFSKFSPNDIPNKFSISSKSPQTKIRDKDKKTPLWRPYNGILWQGIW